MLSCLDCIHCKKEIMSPYGFALCFKERSIEFKNPHIFCFESANGCRYYEEKENKLEELKITKEKVLEASKTCPQAKETLKTLFPEVFEEQFKDFDLFSYEGAIRIHFKNNFYDLNRQHCSNTKMPGYKYIGDLETTEGKHALAEFLKSMLMAKK